MVLQIVMLMVYYIALGTGKDIYTFPRIVGGSLANSGEFPYMVSLQVNGNHKCGGTIINNNTVLTAAHCIMDNITVHAGVNDLNEKGNKFSVASATRHPKYDSFYYDVGLLKIDGIFNFGSKIRPIVLEDKHVDPDVPCISCGWGQLNFTSETSLLLRYVELKTISNEVCHIMYTPVDILIGLQHMCSLAKIDHGVCLGDSGGPLINLEEKQIGIVSFVRPCAVGFPDAYTRISHFLPWINENI